MDALKKVATIVNQSTEDKARNQIFKLHIRVKRAFHMKAKDKEVKLPTTTPSKTAISNYGRRNNLPEHVQAISISFRSGTDTPKKGGRSASSRWFQRFRSVQVTWGPCQCQTFWRTVCWRKVLISWTPESKEGSHRFKSQRLLQEHGSIT